jgi:hypothetical protein
MTSVNIYCKSINEEKKKSCISQSGKFRSFTILHQNLFISKFSSFGNLLLLMVLSLL